MKVFKTTVRLLMAVMLIAAAVPLAMAQGNPQHQQQVIQMHMKQMDELMQQMSRIQDRAHHINQLGDVPLPGAKGPKKIQYNHMVDMSAAMERAAEQMKVVMDQYGKLVRQEGAVSDQKVLDNLDHLREQLTQITTNFDHALNSMEDLMQQQKKISEGP